MRKILFRKNLPGKMRKILDTDTAKNQKNFSWFCLIYLNLKKSGGGGVP